MAPFCRNLRRCSSRAGACVACSSRAVSPPAARMNQPNPLQVARRSAPTPTRATKNSQVSLRSSGSHFAFADVAQLGAAAVIDLLEGHGQRVELLLPVFAVTVDPHRGGEDRAGIETAAALRTRSARNLNHSTGSATAHTHKQSVVSPHLCRL